MLVRSGETIQPLGPNLMGDQLNEYSGGLAFNQTDVSLPGNNALPVAVGRQLAVGVRQAAGGTGLFGDWDLEIPRLHTLVMFDKPNWYGGNGFGTFNLNRCSQLTIPPVSAYGTGTKYLNIRPESWWDGYHLYVPGSGDQTMLSRAGGAVTNPIQPSDGAAYPVVTKQHWQFSCLPTLERGAGEGFLARSPDGTRYQFDHLVQRAYAGFDMKPNGVASRFEVWILPTVITDRFGNWVRYTYGGDDGWRVMSITSSDGRSITFQYTGSGNRIQSVSDGTRTWTYGYDGNGALETVTLPDNSQWRFALGQLKRDPYALTDMACGGPTSTGSDNVTRLGTITHPSGAVGTFGLRQTAHGRTNVPGTWEGCEGPHQLDGVNYVNFVPLYFSNYALASKTLSGPGMPAMTWAYSYSVPQGNFAPCGMCTGSKSVTINDPQNNTTTNTYGTNFGINEGLLLASVQASPSGVLQSSVYGYSASNAGPYPSKIGYNSGYSDSMSIILTPQNLRKVMRQNVDFAWSANAFDVFGNATAVSRANSLGYSRTESTTYYDQTALWVLSQPAGQTIAGVQASSTSYDAATALPTASYKFGKLRATYAFNADGTLARITDGLNQATSTSNYMRGLPQRIDYADGSFVTGVVHNIGVLASTTNEAGTTWNYTYDSMGRLASKTPPGGDAVAYNPTTLSFVQVATPEYGLEAGHWRQTLTTGAAVTANYFDARWRKRLTITYDANNPSATQRLQRFDYDPYNRTTFAAYPARSIGSITDAVPGTATTYDALGRPTVNTADSELGTLTTTTAYLDGFQKRVTNPRGFATTTSFQVFDEPSESAITAITAPEGVSVTINRDTFGKPLSITRGGNGASATRSYVYDANQLLCKTLEPEIGATVQFLDAANNLSWRAIGLDLTSTNSCDQGSVPEPKKIAHTYDPRNRLTGTGFGDGSPSIGRSYTPDGLPATVTANGSTWTYGYNNRRLLTGETLQFPNGGAWGVPRGYDANGHQNGMTYLDGTNIVFNPNALGEPTQVGGYATGVSYHPNGAVAGYTLGNGVAHATTQNIRGLPNRNIDADVMQDRYDYDANGNVASITDEYEGISSRALGYDGLDRLTVANSPGIWGSASYGYDTLDNLRTSTVGGRSAVHNYNARNQLETLEANGVATGFVYDSQGNVTGRGSQGFYFDQGNRMQLANGKASYRYDGLGRRVLTQGLDGTTTYQMYSQDGQMLARQTVGGSSDNSLTLQIYLGGKTIAETNSVIGTAYLYTDALGSPVAKAGNVPASIGYSCPAGVEPRRNYVLAGHDQHPTRFSDRLHLPFGYTLSGSSCSLSTSSTSEAATDYACPAGWSLAGSTCITSSSVAATPVYSCPSGYGLSGTTCSRTSSVAASSTLSCNGRGSLQAYAGSPSGYKCTTQNVIMKLTDDALGDCRSAAQGMGLPLVATPVSGGSMTCVMGPVQVYACPAGATLSGANCISTVTQAASVSGYSCASGTLSGSSCVTSDTTAASASYSCPAGQSLSGTTCTAVSTSTIAGAPVYSCPSGYNLSGSSCSADGTATMPATAGYSCASGTLSGASCLGALSRTRYEPYGNTAAGTVPNGIGFTGHVNDADTGLVYMQQRYYDPVAGRFLSVDPIVTDANTGSGFNIYEYAKSNPYRYTDPDGRDSIEDETHLGGRGAEPMGVARGMDGGPVRMSVQGARANLAEARAQATAKESAKTSEVIKGTAGGERAGKPFTPAGKAEVKTENAAKNDGQTTCSNCGQATVPAKQSQSGVTPPGNETHVDHITPKSKGGDGSPSNGQILCRDCNLKKSDN